MSDFPEVKDHLVANPDKYDVTQNADGTWTIRPTWVDNPSEVLQEGTPVNAAFLAKIPEAIDAIDTKVTSQLADKATKTYVDQVTQSIATGSPKGTYATVAALTTAFPTGNTNIYVVSADGNWYYWNGTAWTAGGVYQATGIANATVSTEKTDFFIDGKNLFNKNAVTAGQRVNGSTGQLFAMAAVNTSEFINVQASTSYYRSHTEAYAIYDANNVYISGGDSASANKVINIPANGAKVRLSVKDADLNTYQFEKGATGTAYERFKNVLSDTVKLQDKSLPKIALDMTNFGHTTSASKNLVDPSKVSEGLINADGSISTPHPYYDYTDYIYVKGAMTMTITGTQVGLGPVRRSYAFYDANKTFIGGFTGASSGFTNPVNVPTNAYFARFTFDSSCTDYQVEYGSLATPYTAFVPKYEVLPHVLPDAQSESISPVSGKALVTNGDSITFGTTGSIPFTGGNYDNQVPWPQFVAQTLKMSLSNHAIGGSTIAVKEASPTERDPIVTRYTSMADGDVIIIAGGSNDWQYSWTPLGDMTSRTNFTFYGALHNLCLGLLEKYKGKQIIFTTPIKRGQLSQESTNANGKTLAEYGQIIKQVCGYYGIPVIDMYNECTINPHIDTQRSEFIPDTVHPNRAGHEVMSKRITGYLRQLA